MKGNYELSRMTMSAVGKQSSVECDLHDEFFKRQLCPSITVCFVEIIGHCESFSDNKRSEESLVTRQPVRGRIQETCHLL